MLLLFFTTLFLYYLLLFSLLLLLLFHFFFVVCLFFYHKHLQDGRKGEEEKKNEMVLHKWAVVNKSAPPPALGGGGGRPIPRTLLHHAKLLPSGYKIPYVIRPFVKEKQLCELQHVENRGMYKEELSLERFRFPSFQSTFVIQTDGAVNEREIETSVPPLMILFYDRSMAFRHRQLALSKIGQLQPSHSWERVPRRDSGSHGGNEISSSKEREQGPFVGEEEELTLEDEDLEDEGGEEDGRKSFGISRRKMVCNALEFPYCVPKMSRIRAPSVDPLSVKSMIMKEAKESQRHY